MKEVEPTPNGVMPSIYPVFGVIPAYGTGSAEDTRTTSAGTSRQNGEIKTLHK